MTSRLGGLSASLFLAAGLVLLLGGFKLPGAVQRLWRQADRAMARKDYAQARQLYEQAQQERPDDWTLRYNAATVAAMAKDYEKAIAGLQSVAKSGPTELREAAEFNTGNCYLAQGKAKEAVAHYQRALYLKPDDVNAKWNLELAKRQQQQQKQQEQQKPQEQKQNQSPPPKPQPQKQPQSGRQMSRDEAQRLLQSLSQQERDLQKQLRQPKRPLREARPEKDW